MCLRRINVEKCHKCKYMFKFPLKNLARKGLKASDDYYLDFPNLYWDTPGPIC